NRHTPFKDPIHSSNLCSEIALPTAAYNHITELYAHDDISFVRFESDDGTVHCLKGGDPVASQRGEIRPEDIRVGDTIDGLSVARIVKRSSPEVATCNVAGICVDNIDSDEQYTEVAYYALLMIDKCIHLAHYELPQVG